MAWPSCPLTKECHQAVEVISAMDLTNKRVLVVGIGKSGVAAALFLKSRCAHVTISDTRPQEQFQNELPLLLDQGIAIETGGHGDRTFQGQDLIVVSPGVPTDAPILQQARSLGETVIGELELAARFFPGRMIAITGSNGKTTTTALTGKIVAAGGLHTVVGGNIGTPAISLVEMATHETVAVLEVSSFQLETIQTFRPDIAAVLNVTPDHLDRHRSFDAYTNAKARIFENQLENDFCVLNADDSTCVKLAGRTRSQIFWFSRMKEVNRGSFVQNGHIIFRDENNFQEIMPLGEIGLKGPHNIENVLAACTIGMIMKCSAGQIRKAVREFKAVEHRLEYVATIRGVEYYNDSKATNVDATIKAIESFPGNIHLILGGKDKGSDYSVLNNLLRERVKAVYTIGAAAVKIESQINEAAEIVRAGTLEIAVKRASAAAKSGDVVLLAPACASFDQFKNYEQRGQTFRDLVQALEKQSTTKDAKAHEA